MGTWGTKLERRTEILEQVIQQQIKEVLAGNNYIPDRVVIIWMSTTRTGIS
ncbi:MAG: hypothetical protein GX263_03080 [Firmicutes bacterium]|jgi:hypothetical protein|nr:hypothetical protein [Bacillota bacterium]